MEFGANDRKDTRADEVKQKRIAHYHTHIHAQQAKYKVAKKTIKQTKVLSSSSCEMDATKKLHNFAREKRGEKPAGMKDKTLIPL